MHSTFLKVFLLLTLLLLLASACERVPVYVGELLTDPVDTTGNGGGGGGNGATGHPCDPDTVYFERQIMPLLTSNCALSGCHDPITHEEGIILTDYAHVMAYREGINMNTPSESKLYKVLRKSDPKDRMPPDPYNALTAEQQALILTWIAQGAQNLTCDGCDTTAVTYSATIAPMLQTRCQGCHGNTNPGGNIKLLTYADARVLVESGALWGSVNHEAGFVAMPYPAGSPKIPACEVAALRIWIAGGALNN